MLYVVSYDISSNRLRTKVADEMQNYGKRIQYSVFECQLDQVRFKKMYKKLMQMTDNMENGSVRIYPICAKCEGKILTMGQIPERWDVKEEPVIVI